MSTYLCFLYVYVYIYECICIDICIYIYIYTDTFVPPWETGVGGVFMAVSVLTRLAGYRC